MGHFKCNRLKKSVIKLLNHVLLVTNDLSKISSYCHCDIKTDDRIENPLLVSKNETLNVELLDDLKVR